MTVKYILLLDFFLFNGEIICEIGEIVQLYSLECWRKPRTTER